MTPRPDHPALAVRDLHRHYGSGERLARALDGVDVTVDHGRFVAVMGPSGSGKSTLLACIAGLDRPSAGTVGWLGGLGTTADVDLVPIVLGNFEQCGCRGSPARPAGGARGPTSAACCTPPSVRCVREALDLDLGRGRMIAA